jgi:hypothetical protein
VDEIELERCPVCRARQRGDEPPHEPCRRCEADLSHVRAAFEAARRLQRRARRLLRDGRPIEAARSARRAVELVDQPSTRATLAAALAAARLGASRD